MQWKTPDPRAAALVSLLHALKSDHRIVDPKEYSLTRMELQVTAKELSESDWASEAACEAVEAMMAGVAASIRRRPQQRALIGIDTGRCPWRSPF
jgi:hypothetical protein